MLHDEEGGDTASLKEEDEALQEFVLTNREAYITIEQVFVAFGEVRRGCRAGSWTQRYHALRKGTEGVRDARTKQTLNAKT